MLQINNLHATINGKEILKGINLTVRDGEVHAIMGLNGAGKSTLSNVIVGHPAYEVTKGDIIFNGKDTRSPNNDRNENFYDIKADVESLIMSAGYHAEFRRGHEPFAHSGQTADILVDGVKVGWLARLKPAIEQELDVSEGVYAFEIDITFMRESKRPEFKPSSQFPASYRDISLLVSIDRSNDDVMSDIRDCVSESASDDVTLEKLRLFDVYSGKGIPEGFRSLAYSLSYRSDSRTLKDEEVESVHMKVREDLKSKGYVIR